MLTVSLAPMVIGFMVVGFLLVSLLMILIVMIQRPQGGGLSEAFGSSSGSGHTAFGAKTGDALTTATIGIFILFIVAAIVLNFATRPSAGPIQAQASPAPEEQQAPTSTDGTPAPTTQTIIPTRIEDPIKSGAATIVEPSLEETGTSTEDAGDDAAPATEEPAGDEPSGEDDPQ